MTQRLRLQRSIYQPVLPLDSAVFSFFQARSGGHCRQLLRHQRSGGLFAAAAGGAAGGAPADHLRPPVHAGRAEPPDVRSCCPGRGGVGVRQRLESGSFPTFCISDRVLS